MNLEILQKYADLLVSSGVNLQKGQMLVVTSDLENAEFVRKIVDAGYKHGASEVVVVWSDEYVTQQRFLKSEDFVFDEIPKWLGDKLNYYDVERDACYVHVRSDDPELLKSVLSDRISRNRKSNTIAQEEHRKRTMSSERRWTLGAVPSPAWAAKVFPDIPQEKAVRKLWEAIAFCSRLDTTDPTIAWAEHNNSFQSRTNFLNSRGIQSMHFKNSLGTDLHIEFPKGAIWRGGANKAKDGVYFFPNIPTEEIFTLPKRTGVNGKVASSMPLCYSGNLIEDMVLDFKDGRITGFSASKNQKLLEHLIETDEGSHYLGEVALVPHKSPISDMNMLFYETLYDENASCHLAIGKAYPDCMEDTENMSKEELIAAGVNDSLTHVDFMIGTPDMKITAVDKDGNQIDIFVDGNYAKDIS